MLCWEIFHFSPENKCYAYVVEGRKPKRSSRQILKDRCWFKQNLYAGGNKGPRRNNWIQDREKILNLGFFVCYSLHEESRFQICNRFTSIQIIKLEQCNFATQRTQFNWTEESNKRLAEGSDTTFTAAPLLGPFFPNSCFLVYNSHFFFQW